MENRAADAEQRGAYDWQGIIRREGQREYTKQRATRAWHAVIPPLLGKAIIDHVAGCVC